MKRVFAALVVLCTLAAPAVAADVYFKAPIAKKYNWTGWYAGIDAGYFDGETFNTPRTAGVFENANLDGGLVSLNIGYRWHLPTDWVYGLQFNAPVYATKQRPVVPVGGLQTGEMNWAFYGTGQIGRAYGRWLPYVEAGIGALSIEQNNTAAGIVQDQTHMLYTVGLGVNYALTDRITTGIKYQYLRTTKENYPSGGAASADYGIELNIISLQAQYRF